MENINIYAGNKIRNYRKMKKMTLQQLADTIHKSRATVSKYETGDISLDLATLYDISQALDVGPEQLVSYRPKVEAEAPPEAVVPGGMSPFYRADRLYFYFYDGRYDRLKEGVITVHKNALSEDGCVGASLSIHASTETGRSSEVYYSGSVLYSDMLIRFSFLNQYNKLEQDLLYIFNPLELRGMTEGLLCGISSSDLKPCAFKCLVSLEQMSDCQELRQRLCITPRELRRWQKINMFMVDNPS